MKSKRQTITVDPDFGLQLKAIAQQEGRTIADTVRRLLKEAICFREADGERSFDDASTETLVIFLTKISALLRERLIKSPEIPDLIRDCEEPLISVLGSSRYAQILGGSPPTEDEIILLKALLPDGNEAKIENWATKRDRATNGHAAGS